MLLEVTPIANEFFLASGAERGISETLNELAKVVRYMTRSYRQAVE